MDNYIIKKPIDHLQLSSSLILRPPIINSDQLFKKSREIIIIHENTTYKLKKTRNGKLILNK